MKKSAQFDASDATAGTQDGTSPRLKLKWSAKKGDPDNGGYNVSILTNILNCYGNITALIVSGKRNGSAIVEFDSGGVDAAVTEEAGLVDNPFTLTWISGSPRSADSETIKTGGSEGYSSSGGFNSSTGVRGDFSVSSGGEGGNSVNFVSGEGGMTGPSLFPTDSGSKDFENLVLRRMRQAEERKKLIQQMTEQDDADTGS